MAKSKNQPDEQMLQWQIKADSNIKRFGPAWVRMKKDIRIVHLEGTDYQMGYQHGKLLEEDIRKGALFYFTRYLDNTIAHSPFGSPSWLFSIAKGFVNLAFLKPLQRSIPPEEYAVMEGLRDALELPNKLIKKASVAPDIIQYLAARLSGSKKDYLRTPPIACTSFMASGEASASGHAIMGHNKDYEGMEYWEPYHAALFCKPEKGNRYVIFGTAGVPVASLGGMNEHGLAFTVHTILTKDVSSRGLPLACVGRRILQEAKSTRDAIEIMKSLNTQVGWKFIVLDKSGEGAAIEVSATHNHHYFLQHGILGCGNLNENPQSIKDELNMNQSMMNNFASRQQRMKDLLIKHHGSIDQKLGVEFLGDHFDIMNQTIRSTGNVIAQMTNIMTFIVDCTENKFWLGSGMSPVCNTTYRGFEFEEGFSESGRGDVTDIASSYNDSKMYQGLRHYIQGSNAHFVDHDLEKAIHHLKEALKYDSEEIYYHQVAGIVSLQLGQYNEGESYLRKSLTLKCSTHKKAIGYLWLGRSLDLQKKRQESIQAYKNVLNLEGVDPRVVKSIRKHIKKPYRKGKLRSLGLSFWLGDIIE